MRTLAISFCVAAFLHASSNAGAKCPSTNQTPSGCLTSRKCDWTQDIGVCSFTKCGGAEFDPGNLKITQTTLGTVTCESWPGIINVNGICIRNRAFLPVPIGTTIGITGYQGIPCR